MAHQTSTAPSHGESSLPQGEELFERLKVCVEEVFTSMVIAFNEAASSKTESGDLELTGAGGESEPAKFDLQFAVDFSGLLCGSVALRCTSEGGQDIARGLLMMEAGEAIEAADIEDALGECANMMTGALKTAALDPHGDFQLGLPYKVDDWKSNSRSIAYRLTEGAVSIEISLGSSGDEDA